MQSLWSPSCGVTPGGNAPAHEARSSLSTQRITYQGPGSQVSFDADGLVAVALRGAALARASQMSRSWTWPRARSKPTAIVTWL